MDGSNRFSNLRFKVGWLPIFPECQHSSIPDLLIIPRNVLATNLIKSFRSASKSLSSCREYWRMIQRILLCCSKRFPLLLFSLRLFLFNILSRHEFLTPPPFTASHSKILGNPNNRVLRCHESLRLTRCPRCANFFHYKLSITACRCTVVPRLFVETWYLKISLSIFLS